MTENHSQELEQVQGDVVDGVIQSFNASVSGIYSSYKSDDFNSKLMLVSALSDSEPIAEHLGEVIELTHIVIQPVKLVNERTGELESQPRTVMIDANGKAYNAISNVIVSRLRDIVGVLGEPHTWPEPVRIRVDRVKGQGANFFYDLRVVTGNK